MYIYIYIKDNYSAILGSLPSIACGKVYKPSDMAGTTRSIYIFVNISRTQYRTQL